MLSRRQTCFGPKGPCHHHAFRACFSARNWIFRALAWASALAKTQRERSPQSARCFELGEEEARPGAVSSSTDIQAARAVGVTERVALGGAATPLGLRSLSQRSVLLWFARLLDSPRPPQHLGCHRDCPNLSTVSQHLATSLSSFSPIAYHASLCMSAQSPSAGLMVFADPLQMHVLGTPQLLPYGMPRLPRRTTLL